MASKSLPVGSSTAKTNLVGLLPIRDQGARQMDDELPLMALSKPKKSSYDGDLPFLHLGRSQKEGKSGARGTAPKLAASPAGWKGKMKCRKKEESSSISDSSGSSSSDSSSDNKKKGVKRKAFEQEPLQKRKKTESAAGTLPTDTERRKMDHSPRTPEFAPNKNWRWATN